jgi:hypothetical protein
MNATKTIEDALGRLARSGASRGELDQARAVLRHLVECNRSSARVDLGRGVTVTLPPNAAARGLTLQSRVNL